MQMMRRVSAAAPGPARGPAAPPPPPVATITQPKASSDIKKVLNTAPKPVPVKAPAKPIVVPLVPPSGSKSVTAPTAKVSTTTPIKAAPAVKKPAETKKPGMIQRIKIWFGR